MSTITGYSRVGTDFLHGLMQRRSVAVTALAEPGPNADELQQMLAAAARVPDHGMLEPWRFLVIEGEARQRAGALLAEAYEIERTDLEPEKRKKFKDIMARVFSYAPVVVIVISTADPAAKVPEWEQQLSSGAVCMNLLHAADALGFGAVWLTGWAAYSARAHAVLGLSVGEKVSGIIHIGSVREQPAERRRPDLAIKTAWWEPPAGR